MVRSSRHLYSHEVRQIGRKAFGAQAFALPFGMNETLARVQTLGVKPKRMLAVYKRFSSRIARSVKCFRIIGDRPSSPAALFGLNLPAAFIIRSSVIHSRGGQKCRLSAGRVHYCIWQCPVRLAISEASVGYSFCTYIGDPAYQIDKTRSRRGEARRRRPRQKTIA